VRTAGPCAGELPAAAGDAILADTMSLPLPFYVITAGILGAPFLFAACGSGGSSSSGSSSSGSAGTGGVKSTSSASGSAAGDAASSSVSSGPFPASDGGLLPGLHVSGNHIVNSAGTTVRLLGVDRSGSEYSCVNGDGIFDGDVSSAALADIAAWKTNVVRVPLNEDCWLGIGGVAAEFSGTNYISQVAALVTRLETAGLYVILDLHWNAPTGFKALGQLPMADADNSPAFWTSVATQFKDDDDIIFDLYNEPYISTMNAQTSDTWECWLNGCMINPGAGSKGSGPTTAWMSAGMQSLVTAVRNTGATQIIMLGGLNFANTFDGFVANLPNDPLKNIAVSFHVYNFTGGNTQAFWSSTISGLAATYPVVTGELGENDCASTFIDTYMTWADTAGVSYLAWAWNTANCSTFPALVTDYQPGTPSGFGAGFKAHLATVGP
jgi:endoglucanase